MDYLRGLAELKSQLPGEALAEYYVLEARLQENLEQERLFGGTEMTRASRSQIVAGLNDLARRYNLGASYNDLCLQRPPRSPGGAS